MSRINRILIFVFTILFISLPAFAQDSPEEQAQQMADEQAKQLMQEMQEMGLTGEDGELDMEALQQMQEEMASMFEQVNVPAGPYENSDYSYRFEVPEGWTGVYVFGVLTIVKGDINQMMAQSEMTQPSMMIIALPPEEIEDDIDIENADLAMVKANLEGSQDESVKISVVEVKHAKIEGHKAVFAEMIQTISSQSMEGMQPISFEVHSAIYMFEANGLRYNLMFASPVDQWKDYVGFFQAQVDKFKLMD